MKNIEQLYNIDAEKAVLGSILINKEAFYEIEGKIKGSNFFNSDHQILFDILSEMISLGEPVDLLTVLDKVNKTHKTSPIVDEVYLADLTTTVPSATNIKHYANIVKEYSVKRKLVVVGDTIIQEVNNKLPVENIIEKSEKEIYNIASDSDNQEHLKDIKTITNKAVKKIIHIRETGEIEGLKTGYENLDNKLGGLKKSDIIIIAARPSVGKSSLVLNLAENIINNGNSVMFFSLEMSSEQLIQRMLSSLSEVDNWCIQTGKISDEQLEKVQEAQDKLNNTKLFIDATPAINLLQMKSRARKIKRKHGLDVIFVDYLQLMSSINPTGNANYDVGEISKGLKQMAKELDVPIIVLSQLSRNVEHRGRNAEPRLADLRDSGAIEQDADIVMFLHREMGEDGRLPETKLIIAKHRNGATGNIYMYFNDKLTKFTETDKIHSETLSADDDIFSF